MKRHTIGVDNTSKKNLDEPIFKLKVPESTKYEKDGQWFKDYVDYLIPYDTTVVSEYSELKMAYDILNNNLDEFREEIEKYRSPLGEELLSGDINREQILPFNKIPDKANIYTGELLKRNDDPKIILTSSKEVAAKNDQYKQKIYTSIEQQAQLTSEQALMRANGASPQELEEHKAKYIEMKSPEDLDRKDFQTDWEIFNSRALKYCMYSEDITTKQQLSMKHAIASDRVFLKVGWKYGRPSIDVCNPLFCGFHKSPDVDYVQHGDYFWHKTPITLADAYNEFMDELSDEDVNRLGVYNYNSALRVDERHNPLSSSSGPIHKYTTFEMLRDSQDKHDKTVGQAMGNGTNRKYNNTRLIWKTHIEFKAFREIVFLTTIDEMGQEITKILDKGFVIPSNASKTPYINKFGHKSNLYEWSDNGSPMKAERLWIPRRYEITRLSQDVYVRFREVPGQPLNLDNPYGDFELSYKGRIFSNVNSKSISTIQRAIPIQIQYFLVKAIQMRELAKYQGFTLDIDIDQIPDYLALDHNGEQIEGRDKVAVWNMYLKRLGYNLYSGSQTPDGTPISTRSPGSRSSMTGTAVELINLGQLLEIIDREIGMAMGISPQRQSSFSSNTNVTDNQQAIAQSHHMTEPLFYMHSEIWKHAFNEWLRLFRLKYKKFFKDNPDAPNQFIEYVTPNNSKELLEITPETLDHEGIGLFLSSGGQDQVYRDSMMQMVHAFGQNAGEGVVIVSDMLKAIAAGESPSEIHKRIQEQAANQAKREEQMQQMQAEQAKQLQQMQIEAREDEQAHEIAKINRQGEIDFELRAMDVYKFQQELDKDNDGIPDPIEAANMARQIKKDQQDYEIAKDKIQVEREKIAASKVAKPSSQK